ncbi:MutS protein msh5 [Arachnomyces sp. PD_36]|nr:MutS protein msh5 [Arachnomyces sp. PD_36]
MPSSKRQRGLASTPSSNRFKARRQRGRGGNAASRSQLSHSIDFTPPSAPPPSLPHSNGRSSQQADSPSHELSVDEGLDQVIMAVDMKERETVGCCYYVAQEEKLYLLEDVKAGGMEIIETLKLDVSPTVVLASTRVDQTLENDNHSIDHEGNGAESDAQFRLPYQVDVRPGQEFGYEVAKNKLASIGLGSANSRGVKFYVPGDTFDETEYRENSGFTTHQGKVLHLSGYIDIENRVSVGCAGAVLTHLQRKRAANYLPGDRPSELSFGIKSIEMLSLKGTMFVNADTLASLQVLQSESHPSAFNQGPGKTSSGSKESLSVYGLFHHFARTPQGKARLRQYFLRPSVDVGIINERQDFIGVFVRPDNAPSLEKLTKSLKSIKNLRPVMIHLHKGVSTGNAKYGGFKSGVWATLLAFAFHAMDIHETLREVIGAASLNLRSRALQKLDPIQLHRVGKAIHDKVDLDSSIEQHRTVVNPGVDAELDRMKETYAGMDSLLDEVAVNIASTIPEEVGIDINVIYFPQLGFSIAVPLDESGRATYDGGDEGWDQVFTTENRAYFKDFRMREMDEKLGDMYGLICEKEIELVYELAQNILTYENMLVEASDICGELDSLLALAQGANLYKLVRPQVVRPNVIDIKGGRHLLQELTVPSFVTNDSFLVGGDGDPESTPDTAAESLGRSPNSGGEIEGPSMLLLTGPNYSGKSVYLKQVALIVYLSHIGSFVPADKATIGLTDKILSRISTRETVSKIQSTFMIDLQQISLALNLATKRSLIIIDEFGKGTDSSDGAGLACGLFEHLLNLGNERPRVLAATHFHELFENGFITARPELQFGYMEVQTDPRAQEIENQITYLYNFRLGRSNASFGTNCAAMNGISPEIVARANELSALSLRGEDLVAVCAKLCPEEMEDLKEAEMIAREFIAADFSRKQKLRDHLGRARDVESMLSAILDISDGASSNGTSNSSSSMLTG